MEIAERCVRDLCWAVNSPSLLGDPRLSGRSESASIAVSRLELDEIDRAHLYRYLRDPLPKRTGRYFERLVLYWLQRVRGCQVTAHSLQVRDGKQTVGEIDLLFRDEDRRLTHWELAVKFYLQVAPGKTDAADYVGPNSHDTLQRKTKRLIEHQLPLSKRYFPDVEIRQAFVKGRIFYPWQPHTEYADRAGVYPSEALPPVLAADHLRGLWMRRSDVATALSTDGLHCRVMKKPFWLADEVFDHSDPAILSPSESICFLEYHFRNTESPVLMTGYRPRASDSPETVPLFVVSDHWPTG